MFTLKKTEKNLRLGTLCGLLSDFISEAWMERLKKHLGWEIFNLIRALNTQGSSCRFNEPVTQDPAVYYNESLAIQKRPRDNEESGTSGSSAKDAKKAVSPFVALQSAISNIVETWSQTQSCPKEPCQGEQKGNEEYLFLLWEKVIPPSYGGPQSCWRVPLWKTL
jgi:hypothetical protein